MRLSGPAAILEAILRLPIVVIVRRTLDAYGVGGGLTAAGLAYTSLFALLSASLLIAGIVGLAVRDPEREAAIVAELADRFPPLAPLLQTGLDGVASGAVQISIVGLLGLAWGTSQVYSNLDIAIARVFGHDTGHGFAIRTLRGFLVVATLIVAIVAAAIATSVRPAVEAMVTPDSSGVRSTAVTVGSALVGVVLYVVIVAVVYRFVPLRPPPWRAMRLPAIAIGIVFAVFNTIFVQVQSLLLGSLQLFSAFGVVLATMIWLSLGFQILLVGAAWVRARDEGIESVAIDGSGDPG